MHKMENTPKIITIIGLVIEGVAAVSTFLGAWFVSIIDTIPGYSESLLEMSTEEFEFYEYIMDFVFTLLIVFAIVYTIMFFLNLFLFKKLMNGTWTEEQAKKVYLYQAIWGGLNVMTNSITGILYLVSGIQGYNGQVDRIETREGI